MDNSGRLSFILLIVQAAVAAEQPKPKAPTMAAVLAAAAPGDWRSLDPENTLHLELSSGRVVIELAPAFAPRHVANVKALARERYYDGLAIVRVQDNYVVQLADPDAEKPDRARKIRRGQKTLPPSLNALLIEARHSRGCRMATSMHVRSVSPVVSPWRVISAAAKCGWCILMVWLAQGATTQLKAAGARSFMWYSVTRRGIWIAMSLCSGA